MASKSGMEGKNCLITGANRGIGKAAAEGLAGLGATILMVSRSQARGEAAKHDIVTKTGNEFVNLYLADLASQAAVRRLAEEVGSDYPELHVLINNAGLAKKERSLTEDGLEMTLAVNHLAPFLLSNLLLDNLQAGAPARIINVSSVVHKWGQIDFADLQGENDYDMDKAYNQSKLANILFTQEMARRLAGSGVTVNSYEPGMTVTDFGREYTGFKGFMTKLWRPFMNQPEEAAQTAIYLASAPEVEGVSGRHFDDKGADISSKASYDRALAGRLWEASEELTRL